MIEWNEKTHQQLWEALIAEIRDLQTRLEVAENRLDIHKKRIEQLENRAFNPNDKTVIKFCEGENEG